MSRWRPSTRLTNVGLQRVLILDWDVHHGNGTNDIFHDSDRVLFASIHQSPLYPGTGSARDVGSGAGTGYTVNLPVAPGSGDAVFVALVAHVVVPLARRFAPELILISAGYDAHRDDPLADCAVTEAGYAAMTRAMRGVAGELQAPLGIVLEGGYALAALAASVRETWPPCRIRRPRRRPDRELVPEAAAARRRLAQWWPDLGAAGRELGRLSSELGAELARQRGATPRPARRRTRVRPSGRSSSARRGRAPRTRGSSWVRWGASAALQRAASNGAHRVPATPASASAWIPTGVASTARRRPAPRARPARSPRARRGRAPRWRR